MARSSSRSRRSRVNNYDAPVRAIYSARGSIKRTRLRAAVQTRALVRLPQADRRFWHPDAIRPTRTLMGRHPRLKQRYSKRGLLAGVGFHNPSEVLVCVRRKARRQVIFAFGGAGGGKRAPRWNYYSHVRC